MVENLVLLDLQHLGWFLCLLFNAPISALEVAVVLCFTCTMVVVHFLLCFSDSIQDLLRFARFQSFRIASIVQEKIQRFSFGKSLKWNGVDSKESLMLVDVQGVDGS